MVPQCASFTWISSCMNFHYISSIYIWLTAVLSCIHYFLSCSFLFLVASTIIWCCFGVFLCLSIIIPSHDKLWRFETTMHFKTYGIWDESNKPNGVYWIFSPILPSAKTFVYLQNSLPPPSSHYRLQIHSTWSNIYIRLWYLIIIIIIMFFALQLMFLLL